MPAAIPLLREHIADSAEFRLRIITTTWPAWWLVGKLSQSPLIGSGHQARADSLRSIAAGGDASRLRRRDRCDDYRLPILRPLRLPCVSLRCAAGRAVVLCIEPPCGVSP